jgi:hypothetical protein
MKDPYRLYVGAGYKTFLSKDAKDPNALEAYLTDSKNMVLPSCQNVFFDTKSKPKMLKNELRPGKEVQIMRVLSGGESLREGSFVVGKVFRIPSLVYSVISHAVLKSQVEYRSAHSKVINSYGEKIFAAQQKEDLPTEVRVRAEMEQTINAFPKELTFEQLVKQLAVHFILKERIKK